MLQNGFVFAPVPGTGRDEVDTTVMEKAIAHPRDSKLLQKTREKLVALARQMNRLKRTNRKAATRVGRIIRELLPRQEMTAG